MKKIAIYYFSGTGNTRYVVEQLKTTLQQLGNNVEAFSCENIKSVSNDFDIIGLAFPIHTSKAPIVFEELLHKLPIGENRKLFAIATAGYIAGDVLNYYHKTFIKLGYTPFLYENYVVGNNLHLPVLCPLKVTNSEKLEKQKTKLNTKVNVTAIKISTVENHLEGRDIFSKMFGSVQRSVGKVHEKKNFKGFFTDETCTKCMWCVNNCPVENIEFKDEKIVFDKRCIICMRCYNFCPTYSIQSTSRTRNKEKYKRYAGIESLKQNTKF